MTANETPKTHLVFSLDLDSSCSPQNILEEPTVCVKKKFTKIANKEAKKKTRMCFRKFSVTLIFLTPNNPIGWLWIWVLLMASNKSIPSPSHVLSQRKVDKNCCQRECRKLSLDFKIFKTKKILSNIDLLTPSPPNTPQWGIYAQSFH